MSFKAVSKYVLKYLDVCESPGICCISSLVIWTKNTESVKIRLQFMVSQLGNLEQYHNYMNVIYTLIR